MNGHRYCLIGRAFPKLCRHSFSVRQPRRQMWWKPLVANMLQYFRPPKCADQFSRFGPVLV